MTFTVNSLTRCAGQGHWRYTLTIAGGPSVNLDVGRDEMQWSPESVEEARLAIIDRLRSAHKEAGATTFAQAQASVEGKVFEV